MQRSRQERWSKDVLMPLLPRHTQKLVHVLQLYSFCNAYLNNSIAITLQLYSKITIPAAEQEFLSSKFDLPHTKCNFCLGPEQEAEIRCVLRARMFQRGPSPDLARTHTNAPQSANISLRLGRGCSGS